MKNNTCFIIGDKTLPANKIEYILSALDREIENLILKGVTNFICTNTPGFDQIAASLIIAKKEMGKPIRLIFILPHKNPVAIGDNKGTTLCESLLFQADEVIYMAQEYNPFNIKRRNRYMIDCPSYCISSLLKETSKINAVASFANKKGVRIINVAK